MQCSVSKMQDAIQSVLYDMERSHFDSRNANHAPAGNRTRVASMATMYGSTRPLMLMTISMLN